MLMCNFVLRSICLSTFSHDVCILASPESIAGGAPNRKMEKLYCVADLITFLT